ncbi:acyl-CoA synthetase (AMP-forming)/AMP-acid ligase II [Xenococcus sp. PCC 7305]|uniref:fatty acyl-AMP ligase n=1 Tax=Xenococcus sp. PCC 7305 TaxID=102125 RepID=UPI0002AC1F9E|nr:fatty acyl-AMP ligase [Xenococcus sp. PCC 7305]ELS04797.1 acyl-CoA synthetase (AMP-forming)/AMP-acid ligase II [Xenococcus sp. PCC 7305]
MSSQPETNIVEILQKRAATQADDLAYIFLKDGEGQELKLTYQELDLKAQAIAAHLQKLVSPGSRALLVYSYNSGLEFITAFFGCLYAGVVAVPCHPPQNRLTTVEVQSRLISAVAEVILTDSSLLNKLKAKLSQVEKSELYWLNTDKLSNYGAENWFKPDLCQDSLAFLQYTSGSTGEPKGVMINHGCLLQNQEMLRLAFGHTQQTIGVGWLPLFHDMGLIGNVIQVVYLGASCVMMSPVSFVQKPIRWLQAISKYKATTSGAPNFAYDLLCDRVKDEQLAQLDLSSWEVAFCGAEPVQAQTLEKFSQKFAAAGFRKAAFFPCYGMAEATLMITGGNKAKFPSVKHLDKIALEQSKVVAAPGNQKGVTTIVSAGYPWLDGKIAIVDPQSLTQCASYQIGEIWFSSSTVGQGYWQLPQATEKTFQASLNHQDKRRQKNEGRGQDLNLLPSAICHRPSRAKPDKFLRTGDLGFIDNGELYITGRLNDVLVFWGLNHYPQHIEQTVAQCHPGLKANCGAAFTVKIAGKEQLVIAQEIERSYRQSLVVDDVVEAIRWAIFQEHFIDIYGIVLLKPGRLPKTSSGKVQRNTCRGKFLDQSLDIWEQWYLSDAKSSDVTALFERYTNPMTYLKILSAVARGKMQRFFYWFWKM